MKIGTKLSTAFLIVVIAMIFLSAYFINVSSRTLENSVGKNFMFLAEDTLEKISSDIEHRVKHLKLYCRSERVISVLETSNTASERQDNPQERITSLDKDWQAAPLDQETQFMKQLIAGGLSRQLRADFFEFWEYEQGYHIFEEVFITNKYGELVAASNRTTDYRQDDENWWQAARKNGWVIQDVIYDESAKNYAVPLCVRIENDREEFIGVIKALLSTQSILAKSTLSLIRHETTEMRLVTKKGKVIDSSRPFQLFEDISTNKDRSCEERTTILSGC